MIYVEIRPCGVFILYSNFATASSRQSSFIARSYCHTQRRHIPHWHHRTYRGQLVSVAVCGQARAEKITLFNALLPKYHISK